MESLWLKLFAPGAEWKELILRGTAIYWFLFLTFRLLLRRDVSNVGVGDILLLVLIADAAQNAMAGGYDSVTDGMILIATLVFWNLLIDWLGYKSGRLRRILEPRPVVLVRNGEMIRRRLARELMPDEELMAKLREHGVDSLAQVRKATMEPDGSISVIRM